MRKSRLTAILLITFLTFGGCQVPQNQHSTENESPQPVQNKNVKTEIKKADKTAQVESRDIGAPPSNTQALQQTLTHTPVKRTAHMVEQKELRLKLKTGAYRSERVFVPQPSMNTESYTPVTENGFITTANDPLSTFSIDVDTASYANIRRFIMGNQLPPVGAVRIEEMINYFSYDYPQPQKGPFSVTTEVGPSPWQPEYQLVRIGLQAKKIDKKNLPASNLVFLIDVSGSMNSAKKLPLLKKSMRMLVDQLDNQDRVAIVVYAGTDRIVLQPTAGDQKQTIYKAIDRLSSGGSTHGSKGIITAYQLAARSYMPKGNNRVILASDGDFNVGVTSRGELQRLIEEQRKSGIYFTTLGFGMGNYHDDTMEILADKGNGNYSYIDSLLEAKKVLVKEMSGTMFTLAKDVKIQVEFNPAKVGAYRLIGYENRALADEDFNDDKKDAGEIGVGHRVTALYELIPAGHASIPSVDPLKYQKTTRVGKDISQELLTVKLRYKPTDSNTSKLLKYSVNDRNNNSEEQLTTDFHFVSAVSAFGMLLKNSEHLNAFNPSDIIKLAKKGKGNDEDGYRAEFIRLVELAELLKK